VTGHGRSPALIGGTVVRPVVADGESDDWKIVTDRGDLSFAGSLQLAGHWRKAARCNAWAVAV